MNFRVERLLWCRHISCSMCKRRGRFDARSNIWTDGVGNLFGGRFRIYGLLSVSISYIYIRMRFGLQTVRVCLFIQYTIALSSLWKLIGRHWTYKMPVRYILSSVWVRSSIFSPLSLIQHVVLYVFSLSISLVMIERINIFYLFIIIMSEVRTITHCLGLGHKTMVPAVCISIFLCANISIILIIKSLSNNSCVCI